MDTSTSYLGLRLVHPFMAGASPLSAHLDSVKRLEDAGCAAVVLHSLFEEQITAARVGPHPHGIRSMPDFADGAVALSRRGRIPVAPDEYVEHLQRVKQAVRIPVIGSMNGTTPESWLKFARLIEQAGADALELNYYEVSTDLDVPGIAIEARLPRHRQRLEASC